MGKKAKSTKGALRAKERKLDKSTLPPPPKAVSDEVRDRSVSDFSGFIALVMFLSRCIEISGWHGFVHTEDFM